ncbi:MAG: SMC-Scp complex subunit ScpB [Thermoplasmata archaeon HGW-Thermoplasmata-1]|nr:MAG: SMC-Scp complex subunit ScpB [Thermoplasmata archaeon HGW-Thermoplasmata-1]
MVSNAGLVEAALFSAGKPLLVDEIMEATGLGKRSVNAAIEQLRKGYDARGDDTCMELGRAGEKHGLQVKTSYVNYVRKLASMEVNPKLLKTLALIAYHQPIKQSDLKEMIGDKVYQHIPELHDLGLVRTRREGQTKILTTTPRFQEYFGIEEADRDKLKQYLAKKVGIKPRTKKGEALLSNYSIGETEPAGKTGAADKSEGEAKSDAIIEGKAEIKVEAKGGSRPSE